MKTICLIWPLCIDKNNFGKRDIVTYRPNFPVLLLYPFFCQILLLLEHFLQIPKYHPIIIFWYVICQISLRYISVTLLSCIYISRINVGLRRNITSFWYIKVDDIPCKLWCSKHHFIIIFWYPCQIYTRY